MNLSFSKLKAYMICPRAYKYHYIDSFWGESSFAMQKGTAIERAVGAILLGFDWQRDIEITNEIIHPQNPEGRNGNLDLIEIDDIKIIFSIAETYLANCDLLKFQDEIEYQKKVTGEFGKYDSMTGYIDFFIPSTKTVIDLKTTKKIPTFAKSLDRLQVFWYGLFLPFPFEEIQFELHYVRSYIPKTKISQMQLYPIFPTIQEKELITSLFKNFLYSVNSNVFPRNMFSFNCSPERCPYWDICMEGK